MEGSAMLVLTRKVGESLIIDDAIRVTVTQISGGNVRIGIEAPSNVRIVREEISFYTEAAEQPVVVKRS
jgi:carbon storage regulator